MLQSQNVFIILGICLIVLYYTNCTQRNSNQPTTKNKSDEWEKWGGKGTVFHIIPFICKFIYVTNKFTRNGFLSSAHVHSDILFIDTKINSYKSTSFPHTHRQISIFGIYHVYIRHNRGIIECIPNAFRENDTAIENYRNENCGAISVHQMTISTSCPDLVYSRHPQPRFST